MRDGMEETGLKVQNKSIVGGYHFQLIWPTKHSAYVLVLHLHAPVQTSTVDGHVHSATVGKILHLQVW